MPSDSLVEQLADQAVGSTLVGSELVKKTEADLATFSDLLNSIDSVDERLKARMLYKATKLECLCWHNSSALSIICKYICYKQLEKLCKHSSLFDTQDN